MVVFDIYCIGIYIYIETEKPTMSEWLDLSNNANCFKSMYIDGFLDLSGGSLQTRGPSDHLLIGGDVSLNGQTYLGGKLLVGTDGDL